MEHASAFGILVPVLEICLIDLLLGGDNAIVIAMACRGLPPPVWRKAVWLGTFAAIVLRIALTALAALVLNLEFLRLIGAVLLFAIAVRLLAQDPQSQPPVDDSRQRAELWRAITTIIVADTAMSLDNVLAVAAASQGSFWLLSFGLALSIPILIFGSAAVARMLDRFPVLILAGGALLGWVAGDTAVSDPAIEGWIESQSPGLARYAPLIGAVYVLIHGRVARSRSKPPSGG
jgi:YjbE family integral membrane protein